MLWGCDPEKHIWREREPRGIDRECQSEHEYVYDAAEDDAQKPEQKAEDVADRRVILVERLEDVFERDAPREKPVEALEPIEHEIRIPSAAFHVPVAYKFEDTVEKTRHEISQRKIH